MAALDARIAKIYSNKTLCFFVVAVWKPKMLSVSQLGSKLHVSFEQAPPSFAFHLYYVYYKLRQDGPFRLQRCKPVRAHGIRT